VNELHVGLKGTMNALFIKDLAIKTRRGLEGRVRKGFSGGGNSFGYDVVREMSAGGEPIRGKRKINKKQVAVIQRIMEEFVAGKSPTAIAHALNHEGIKGPSGKLWGPSTIYGNWKRGTGILNNELYIGKLIWNRQRFMKDPMTGKRQARMNPEHEWIVEDVPHLKVVDNKLWKQVKDRQKKIRKEMMDDKGNMHPQRVMRAKHLLSGLLKCACCGSNFILIGPTHYACATNKNKGTCENRLSIRKDELEQMVLDGLKNNLMHPDYVETFVSAFNAELNKLWATQDQVRLNLKTELATTEKELEKYLQAILNDVPLASIKEAMIKLEKRKETLNKQLATAPAPMPRLHPNLSKIYQRKVGNLSSALLVTRSFTEAFESIRALIKEIRLTPENGKLQIELFGEFAPLPKT